MLGGGASGALAGRMGGLPGGWCCSVGPAWGLRCLRCLPLAPLHWPDISLCVHLHSQPFSVCPAYLQAWAMW
jgi:hypothetical protein